MDKNTLTGRIQNLSIGIFPKPNFFDTPISRRRFPNRGCRNIENRVNTSVAREIADGLGAAILDATNYVEDATQVAEIQESVPAFATVETEVLPVDEPAAEEKAAEDVVEEG